METYIRIRKVALWTVLHIADTKMEKWNYTISPQSMVFFNRLSMSMFSIFENNLFGEKLTQLGPIEEQNVG